VTKKEVFTSAIKENECILFKIASVYTNTTEDKQDLIQEIIYQLWKSYDSFNQQSRFSTWMYRVALNVAIYQLKMSKKRTLIVPMEEQSYNYQIDENGGIEEKWKLFRKQIDGLNLLDKAIVTLYLDDKSYDEIAEVIGISSSNVGTKLSRIKEKLKTQIFNQQ
jgi:RNA polymerase sigma-70 factor (ECF subfamily)